MSFDSPENWIDAELRRVPLPPGLVERLRATSETTDEDIDEALSAVPVPSRLSAQLLAIVGEEELDAQLCDVAVPETLLDNLWAIPYDEALRDVPVPANLLGALRRVAPQPSRWSAARLALAASVMLMLTGAYIASVGGWMMSVYNSSQGLTATVLTLPESPLELTSSQGVPVSMALAEDARAVASVEALPTVAEPFVGEIDIRPIDVQLASLLPAGYRLTDNVLPLRFGILGQHDESDVRGADLEVLQLADPRGLEAPVSVGFDRQFLVKHRTQPIVSLAASPELAKQYLPLWRSSTSFERLRERSAAGRLPDAHEISVEDFLAAMNCPYFPADPGELAIRTAAGPSVFGDGEASLLQIGVQAGPLPHSVPTHTTFVVDASDSMRWSGRLSRVREGLRQFASQMIVGDRVSLVVYNDGAATLLEDAGREDLATIYEVIDGLSAFGGSNFGAGLQQGAIAADSPAALAIGNRRMILIADGLPAMPAAVAAQVNQLVHELSVARVALDVVDVDDADEPDTQLAALAAAGGQALIVARRADTLHRELIARTRGASPEIARSATVEVSFNPKTVKAYRLFGHEAISLGGTPAKVESTLLAGESATVLFEVWLHHEGPSDVADVAVRWVNAAGKEQASRQEVRRVQFVPSFAEAALSLQSATIAAEAAEALRESPFSSARSRDLRPVLKLAGDVNPRLAARPEFRRFVQVLQQAERAR